MTVANPGQPQSASTQAITALILGILGIICCGLMAPVAWYIGNQELKAIQSGTAPVAGQGLATAGKILGMIGSIILVFSIFWIFFMGGMAILQGVLNSH